MGWPVPPTSKLVGFLLDSVEDLNVTGMLEDPQNARNKVEVGWRDFINILEHHGERNGCHVVQVEPRGTIEECAAYGVSTDEPLWVREHSCPTCGFELDRDWNVALNALIVITVTIFTSTSIERRVRTLQTRSIATRR
jgi:transposase